MLQDIREYQATLSQLSSAVGIQGCPSLGVGQAANGGGHRVTLIPFSSRVSLLDALSGVGQIHDIFPTEADPSSGSWEWLLQVTQQRSEAQLKSSTVAMSVISMRDLLDGQRLLRWNAATGRWVVAEATGRDSVDIQPIKPWGELLPLLIHAVSAGSFSVRRGKYAETTAMGSTTLASSSSVPLESVVIESSATTSANLSEGPVCVRWYLPLRHQVVEDLALVCRVADKVSSSHAGLAAQLAHLVAENKGLAAQNAALMRDLAAERERLKEIYGTNINNGATQSDRVDGAGGATRSSYQVGVGRGGGGSSRSASGPQMVASIATTRGGKRARGVKID